MRKVKCDKCWTKDKTRRYIRIGTEKEKYIFCSKCAYDGYMALFSIKDKRKDEEKLFKQLQKFLAN